MTVIILIIALIFLTFSSGYFSSSETAFFSLSPMKVRAYKASKDSKKNLIAHLLQKPRDLLVTVFMLNTLVNILLQNVASSMFGAFAGWGLKVGVPLFLTLIFGEVIPKNFGLQRNEWLAKKTATSINFFQTTLAPIRTFFVRITAPISRFLFFYLSKEESISDDELQHVLEQSEEHKLLQPEETELIKGYLTVKDSLVKELMRPKEDILFYSIKDPLSKLIHLFLDQQCTRIPICDGDLDNVIGVITARHYFLNQPMIKTAEDLRRYVMKPFYIPEATPARMLLRRFDQTRRVLALVVNEYGLITGLITREDLVEIVIGEIADLRDQKRQYTVAGNEEIIASGKLELVDFNRIFQTSLESRFNTVTLGGWLIEEMGDIPKTGSLYETDQFFFQILSSDPNRIRRIYVRYKGGGN